LPCLKGLLFKRVDAAVVVIVKVSLVAEAAAKVQLASEGKVVELQL